MASVHATPFGTDFAVTWHNPEMAVLAKEAATQWKRPATPKKPKRTSIGQLELMTEDETLMPDILRAYQRLKSRRSAGEISGAGVAVVGAIFAWAGLGWMVEKALQGTLQRLGVWAMFFLWCRKEFAEGRHPRLYHWIFRETLPTPDPDHLDGCAALSPGHCSCGLDDLRRV